MRSYRVASLALAVLALAAVSACKETTSTGLGAVTCAAADAFLCPPSTLDLGYTGPTGAPTIVPGTSGTSVSTGSSTYTITGTTTATLPGYWLLVQDGVLVSWGVLSLSGGVYNQEVPLQGCGTQHLIAKFQNSAGTAYYVVELTRTGCAGPGTSA